MQSLLGAAVALIVGSLVAVADNAPPERPWTILVYGAADNNADGPILAFLDQVRTAIDDDPGIELVLFLDRHEQYSDDARSLGANFTGARIYRLRRDSAERLEAGEFFPGMDGDGDWEVDSADPENLKRFLAFGKARFPARSYGLMIYSHASGRTMCPDEQSGRDMGIAQLPHVVGKELSVDFLALELCNMAGLEIAYQWRPGNGGFGADVLLAIPNAGPPLDWDRAFARIRSPGHAGAVAASAGRESSIGPSAYGAPALLDPATMAAEDFGRLVVEEGLRGRQISAKKNPERALHESAGCFDLRASAEAKKAVDELAVALARSGAEGRAVFLELRGPGPIGYAMNYSGGGPFVDVYDLCRRAESCDALSEEVRAAAGKVLSAMDRLVIASFGMAGYEDFEADRNGLFIVLPAGGDPGWTAESWKEFAWYTPLPEDQNGTWGRWAFMADGATAGNGVVENWFELLDSWFDDTAKDPAGLNGYRW